MAIKFEGSRTQLAEIIQSTGANIATDFGLYRTEFGFSTVDHPHDDVYSRLVLASERLEPFVEVETHGMATPLTEGNSDDPDFHTQQPSIYRVVVSDALRNPTRIELGVVVISFDAVSIFQRMNQGAHQSQPGLAAQIENEQVALIPPLYGLGDFIVCRNRREQEKGQGNAPSQQINRFGLNTFSILNRAVRIADAYNANHHRRD